MVKRDINSTDICVYFHINPSNDEIFYVGIGNIDRPYSKFSRSKWWHNIVNKHGFFVKIIKEELAWKDACILEIKYIKEIGRRDLKSGSLINLTDGGDGHVGFKCSDETKHKMSIAQRGHKTSIETRKKIGEKGKLKTQSQESRNKISKSLKSKPDSWRFRNRGKKLSTEHCQNISNGLNTFYTTEDSIKLKNEKSELLRKYWTNISESEKKTRADKISKSLIGRKATKEARQKMSEAKKGKTPWNKGKKLL